MNVKHSRRMENFHSVQRKSVFCGTGSDFFLIPHQRHGYAQLLYCQCAAFDYLQRCIITAECVN